MVMSAFGLGAGAAVEASERERRQQMAQEELRFRRSKFEREEQAALAERTQAAIADFATQAGKLRAAGMSPEDPTIQRLRQAAEQLATTAAEVGISLPGNPMLMFDATVEGTRTPAQIAETTALADVAGTEARIRALTEGGATLGPRQLQELRGVPLSPEQTLADARAKARAGRMSPAEAAAIKRAEMEVEEEFAGGPSLAFEGTGMQQQIFNVIMEYNTKVRSGIPTTPEEDRRYALAVAQHETPKTVTGPQGQLQVITPTLPAEFVRPGQAAALSAATPGAEALPAPAETAAGSLRVETVGREREKPIAEAGRQALVNAGRRAVDFVRDRIINPDGSINRGNVATMQNILGFEGVPFSEGRTIRSTFRDALSAITRLETGAQLNEAELIEIQARFLPSPFDSDEAVRNKIDRLEVFFKDSLRKADPDLYQQLINRGREGFADDVEFTAAQRNLTIDEVIQQFAARTGRSVEEVRADYERDKAGGQ